MSCRRTICLVNHLFLQHARSYSMLVWQLTSLLPHVPNTCKHTSCLKPPSHPLAVHPHRDPPPSCGLLLASLPSDCLKGYLSSVLASLPAVLGFYMPFYSNMMPDRISLSSNSVTCGNCMSVCHNDCTADEGVGVSEMMKCMIYRCYPPA